MCIRDRTYNASEGFFGIQDRLRSDEMLLMLDYGVFYEFMPLTEYGKEDPLTIQLDEVELNKNYALVISTNAGLWRYVICLLYTSDAADERSSVDLGGRRILKKKNKKK